MKIIDANFLISSPSITLSPPPDTAEIAFLGRSNVGKSSLLNSLANKKNLAKSSSTPGKTQLINFFTVTFKPLQGEYRYARFVDLPGFGYAKVSKSIKSQWHKNLTEFLEKRDSIQMFIHLIDSRHIDLDIDKDVNLFLENIKRPDQKILKVFTKVDKLKQNDLQKLKNIYRDAIYISNLKKKGIISLEETINKYLFGE